MSTFANYIKKLGDNKEGLTPNYWEVSLPYVKVGDADLAAEVAVAAYTLPVNAMLVKAEMNINASGTVATNTVVSVTRLVGDATTVALATDLLGAALFVTVATPLPAM